MHTYTIQLENNLAVLSPGIIASNTFNSIFLGNFERGSSQACCYISQKDPPVMQEIDEEHSLVLETSWTRAAFGDLVDVLQLKRPLRAAPDLLMIRFELGSTATYFNRGLSVPVEGAPRLIACAYGTFGTQAIISFSDAIWVMDPRDVIAIQVKGRTVFTVRIKDEKPDIRQEAQ